jgi:hypothetical protein
MRPEWEVQVTDVLPEEVKYGADLVDDDKQRENLTEAALVPLFHLKTMTSCMPFAYLFCVAAQRPTVWFQIVQGAVSELTLNAVYIYNGLELSIGYESLIPMHFIDHDVKELVGQALFAIAIVTFRGGRAAWDKLRISVVGGFGLALGVAGLGRSEIPVVGLFDAGRVDARQVVGGLPCNSGAILSALLLGVAPVLAAVSLIQ